MPAFKLSYEAAEPLLEGCEDRVCFVAYLSITHQ